MPATDNQLALRGLADALDVQGNESLTNGSAHLIRRDEIAALQVVVDYHRCDEQAHYRANPSAGPRFLVDGMTCHSGPAC